MEIRSTNTSNLLILFTSLLVNWTVTGQNYLFGGLRRRSVGSTAFCFNQVTIKVIQMWRTWRVLFPFLASFFRNSVAERFIWTWISRGLGHFNNHICGDLGSPGPARQTSINIVFLPQVLDLEEQKHLVTENGSERTVFSKSTRTTRLVSLGLSSKSSESQLIS